MKYIVYKCVNLLRKETKLEVRKHKVGVIHKLGKCMQKHRKCKRTHLLSYGESQRFVSKEKCVNKQL